MGLTLRSKQALEPAREQLDRRADLRREPTARGIDQLNRDWRRPVLLEHWHQRALPGLLAERRGQPGDAVATLGRHLGHGQATDHHPAADRQLDQTLADLELPAEPAWPTRVEDQLVLNQLVGVARLPALQVPGTRVVAVLAATHGPGDECRVMEPSGPESEVESLGDQIHEPIAEVDLHVDMGVALDEL